jgi:hypothetical protein
MRSVELPQVGRVGVHRLEMRVEAFAGLVVHAAVGALELELGVVVLVMLVGMKGERG